MEQGKGRWLARESFAGLAPVILLVLLVPVRESAAEPATAPAFGIAQATQPTPVAPVTYTPIRRAGAVSAPATPPARVPPPAFPPQAIPPPPPAPPPQPYVRVVSPRPSPPPVAAVPAAQTNPAAPASPPPPASTARSVPPSSPVSAAEPAAVATSRAIRPERPGHRYAGLGTDIGMPDGLTLGLVLAPADWIRLGVALGTTSFDSPELAGLYRAGFSLVPLGWGPSFSFEAGRRTVAPMTSVLRYFFSVPAWVNPYVQEVGYTFFNMHLGFDYTVAGLTVFVHGGATFLLGTVRSSKSVIVDKQTSTSISLPQDGTFQAFTLSAKAGLLYLFGGGG